MVDWNNLGTVAPRHFEWQLYSSPAINTDVFRIRHLNAVQVSWGFALLSFLYPLPTTMERYGAYKIYPQYDFNNLDGEASEIIICPIPSQFIRMNYLVREVAILLPKRTPYTPSRPWTISIDASNLASDVAVVPGGQIGGGDDIGGGIP